MVQRPHSDGIYNFWAISEWPLLHYASLGARVIINQGRVEKKVKKNTYYTYVDTKLSDIYICSGPGGAKNAPVGLGTKEPLVGDCFLATRQKPPSRCAVHWPWDFRRRSWWMHVLLQQIPINTDTFLKAPSALITSLGDKHVKESLNVRMPPSRPRSWYGQFCSTYHLLSTNGGVLIARHIE
jgi:hypothetical protein